jgi:hypothetical protein
MPPKTMSAMITPRTRRASALHLRDERSGDGRQDRTHENRLGDGRRQAEQPYRPDQDEAESHQEPAEQPEIAQPHRRGEDARECACVDLDNGWLLDRRRDDVGVAMQQAVEDSHDAKQSVA